MLRFRFLLWGQRLIEKDGRNSLILAPLSWLWGFISFLRNRFYDWEWFKAYRVDRPVISVGNIVAGGTGKTPLVHLIASRFSHRKVAVLSRGYGSIPDEPLLLKRRLPKVRIYIGKNRVELAKKAVEEGAELLILDDGFQHRRLKRDFDLVVLAGSDPYGKGRFLPWGFLRDSPRRLKKADTLFLSGEGEICFPYIGLKLKVDRILDFEEEEIPSISGWKVGLFSGIAKPELFRKTVIELGAEIGAEWVLADHEPVRIDLLNVFIDRCNSLAINALVCTEKDFVKIFRGIDFRIPIYFIEISFEISKGCDLWENLIAKINQKIDNNTRL